jgi:hypothetical protein
VRVPEHPQARDRTVRRHRAAAFATRAAAMASSKRAHVDSQHGQSLHHGGALSRNFRTISAALVLGKLCLTMCAYRFIIDTYGSTKHGATALLSGEGPATSPHSMR